MPRLSDGLVKSQASGKPLYLIIMISLYSIIINNNDINIVVTSWSNNDINIVVELRAPRAQAQRPPHKLTGEHAMQNVVMTPVNNNNNK